MKKKYVSPEITIFEIGELVLAAASSGKDPKINIDIDDWEDEEIGPNGAKYFDFPMDE